MNVPFGAGVVFAGGGCRANCFGIDISPTGFSVSTQPGPGGIAFINGDQAIVKVTTLDTSLINVVSFQTNGLGLSPGALLFGDNFFQVNLAASSLPLPEGNNSSFTVNFSEAPGPAPVPAPASLPLIASGLAALVLARLATRTGLSMS